MKRKCGIGLVLGCLLSGAIVAQEEAKVEGLREWTSLNGNVLEAAFVREEGGKIFLRRADGTTVSTAREKLSPNDLTWIDALSGKAAPKPTTGEGKTQSFTLITSQAEKMKLETFLLIKRFFAKSYADLTNNHREDKSLAFLLRDANKTYGWSNISAECYPLPNGQKGRLKSLTCYPPAFVELKEAVQIAREKFVITMPDPVVVKEVNEGGMSAWEMQNPPEFISRVLLVKDSYSGKIGRFIITFPEPEK